MKKTNSTFIFIYLTFLLFIAFFNYIVNPYQIFRTDKLTINPQFNDDPYIQIKLSKNKKFDSVIIGGSSTKYLNLSQDKNNIADISLYYATLKDLNNLLEFYLKLHPETKTIYFALEIKLFDKREEYLAKNNNTYLTAKEIYKIFLSIDTTKKSIQKLLDSNNDDSSLMAVNPKKTKVNRIVNISTEQLIKNAQSELLELFKIADKNNTKIICFTPPTQANYQARIQEFKEVELYRIKKTIIDKTNYLIDINIPNNINILPINNSNKYFYDEFHTTAQYNKIIQDILFNKNNNYKNLYVILNKNNFNLNQEKQKNSLLIYKEENKEDYMHYIKNERELWKKIHKK